MTPLNRYPGHLRREVLLAIAAYAVALRTFELGAILAVAAIASGYVSEGPRGRTLPRWLATSLAVLIAGWMLFTFLGDPEAENTMAIVGRLACLLATLRLFESRTSRDDRQIVVLSVVAVVAAALYSFQLLFGVIVLAFAAQTILVLMLNRLQAGFERASADRGRVEAESPVPPLEPTSGRYPSLQFRLLSLICIVTSFLVASLVFVIFPRSVEGPGRVLGARTGFTPNVDLARNDRIEQSNREVFTVSWRDPRGVPIEWPQPLLLRGAVLDSWEPRTRRWVDSTRRSMRIVETSGSRDDFAAFSGLQTPRSAYTQTVTMRSLATERVFARWAPVSIACDESRRFNFDPVNLEITDSATGRIGRFSTYSLKVLPSPNAQEMSALLARTDPEPRRTINPFRGSEIRTEAIRILEERAPELLEPIPTDDEDAVWRRDRLVAEEFTEYLRGPDFFYTLDLRRIVRRDDVDPIVAFLRDQRFGNCEYFASALCALCQSLGVEARMVTGFVAVEYDETLRHYIVRESNAHAWVEVRTGPWSWREFDPTSSEILETLQADRRSWADNFRWIYDRFDFIWNSRIVAFDGDVQAAIAEGASVATADRLKRMLAGLKEIARRVNRYFRLGPSGYIWLGVVSLAVLVAIVAITSYLRRRARLRAAIGRVPRGVVREIGFYVDVLQAFERAGCPKPFHTTPRRHLRALARVRPDLVEVAAPLVDLFYEIRFGDLRPDPEVRRSAVAEARRMLELAGRTSEENR
ncbi:MAG: transglutaminaseTgpA domain-containing protein [Planctomycetota bacterium]|nr:transglutaminaseTgpA domain-containing protein [Planctomycetota bacterium]